MEAAFHFATFFIATVAGASLIGCAIDRRLTAWQESRFDDSSED